MGTWPARRDLDEEFLLLRGRKVIANANIDRWRRDRAGSLPTAPDAADVYEPFG